MLSSFSIANFKAFGPAQEIPIRPITLVFGPNSAGKSSIIQSLLLARHAADTGRWDAHQTELGGSAVDLGGFANYVRRHDLTREVELRFEFDLAVWQDRFVFEGAPILRAGKRMEIAYCVGLFPTQADGASPTTLPKLKSLAVSMDRVPVVRINHLAHSRYAIATLNENHPVFEDLFPRFIESSLSPPDYTAGRDDSDGGVVSTSATPEPEVLSAAKQREKEEGIAPAFVKAFKERQYTFDRLKLGLLGPDNRWNWAGWDRAVWDSPWEVFGNDIQESDHYWFVAAQTLRHRIEHIIKVHTENATLSVSGLTYLGPLRCIPPRHLFSTNDQDPNWLAGGGEAWERLRRDSDLRDQVNRFLRDTMHSPYRLRCQHLAPELDAETIAVCVKRAMESSAAAPTESGVSNPNTARVAEDAPPSVCAKSDPSDLAAALQSELRAQTTGEGLTELSLVDDESGLAVSHRDVGTGISQLLPVLVNAAGGEKQLIAIEQPELHLHPALQAELGDVFIESALGENQNKFLIETHSEHLIRRIMRRIRESNAGKQPGHLPRITPDDVAVLFVQPTESGAVVKHLRVDKQGRLMDDWPGGFFEEAFNELF